MASSSVQIREYNLRPAAFKKIRTQELGLRIIHVFAIHRIRQHVDRALLVFRNRVVGFTSECIHFIDHAGSIWFHKLSSLIEVGLKAIIVCWVMAGC